MALTTNLVSYWKLDESSGNASDSVGSLTLTNTNTATYAAAKINNGVSTVSASSQKLGATGTNLPATTTARTLNFWVKTSGAVNDGCVGWGSAHTTSAAFQILLTGGNNVYFGGYSDDLNASTTINDGSWHMITVTYVGGASSALTIYVDNVSKATGNKSLNTTNQVFRIGCRADDSSFSTVSIDEVGIWSRVLSTDEISSLYNGGAGFQYPFVSATTGAAFLLNFVK